MILLPTLCVLDQRIILNLNYYKLDFLQVQFQHFVSSTTQTSHYHLSKSKDHFK